MATHYSMSIRRYFPLVAGLCTAGMLAAQVSTYQFNQSVGTYTPITDADGGITLGVPAYWPHVNNNRAWVNNPYNDPDGQVTMSGYLNPAMGPGYPIGFDFTYNGDVFDRIGISNGGWISFGKSTDGLQAVWVYNWSGTVQGDPMIQWYNGPEPNYKRNRVAGFGNSSLQQVDWSSTAPPGPKSKLRMATIGTAPNRVCVVQWEDYGMRNDVTVSINKINFQIRLYEQGNAIEVVFGPNDWISSLGRYKRTQCGLSGRSNADFNGRMTVYEQPAFLYDWNTTVPMDTMLAFCQFEAPQPFQPNGSGIPPANGLTWRWDPPVCPPPAWPFSVDQITFDAARITWQPSSSGEYEYFVSTANSTSGPEVSSGTTTDTEANLFGLDPSTVYYVFLRSICDGEPGVWSMPVSFITLSGGVVVCDGGVMTEDYCSYQHSTKEWLYVSADGSPLKLEFQGGYLQGLSGESFTLWNGAAPTGSGTSFSGDLTGHFFNAPSGAIFIRLVTEAGACHAQDWYLPLQWRVGCKNCVDPLVAYAVGSVDCDEHQFFIDVNVVQLGSSTSLVLENNGGIPPTTVTSTGIHTVGPFPAGENVRVTAQNPDNLLCYVESVELVNEPCAIVGCGPSWYEKCAHTSEIREWLVQGDGQPISLRLLPGNVGWDADLTIYNGPDDMSPVLFEMYWGTTNNEVITSSNAANQMLVRYEASNYNDFSCELGNTLPLEFVTECASNCEQPQASFTTECVTPTSFNVKVNLTSLGDNASVQLTNSGSAPSYSVSTIGEYVVGPFPNLEFVRVNVEGANAICTWSSTITSRDCLTMGVGEQADGLFTAWPNPTNGLLQVQLPAALGHAQLMVQDLAGRTVHTAQAAGARTMELNLANLPNGLYLLVAQSATDRYTTKISVQH